mmetsp:Transcript_51939/g.130506  ORF Transcript_51939/g.130506 Transcript_51939/m.130506 type:complete len:121 (+) Transcript_51939:2094-2456(+)
MHTLKKHTKETHIASIHPSISHSSAARIALHCTVLHSALCVAVATRRACLLMDRECCHQLRLRISSRTHKALDADRQGEHGGARQRSLIRQDEKAVIHTHEPTNQARTHASKEARQAVSE